MVFENYSERSGSVINFNLLSYLIVQPPHPYKYQMIREKKPDGASALTGCIVQIGALAYVIDFTPQIRIVLYYLPSQFISNIAVPKFGRKKTSVTKTASAILRLRISKKLSEIALEARRSFQYTKIVLDSFPQLVFSLF